MWLPDSCFVLPERPYPRIAGMGRNTYEARAERAVMVWVKAGKWALGISGVGWTALLTVQAAASAWDERLAGWHGTAMSVVQTVTVVAAIALAYGFSARSRKTAAEVFELARQDGDGRRRLRRAEDDTNPLPMAGRR